MCLAGVLQERLPLGCFMCQLFGELFFVVVGFYPFPSLFMNYCNLYDPALRGLCARVLFIYLFAGSAPPFYLIYSLGMSRECGCNHCVQRKPRWRNPKEG